jgi:D-aminoacyl-tRNA deacylase
MRAVVQRVTEASVTVDGDTVGAIGPGLVILLGVGRGDTAAQANKLADKISNLRIFADSSGKFNRSAVECQAEALVVSQFTLYGDTRRGRRPSFVEAAPPEVAEPLVNRFVDALSATGLRVASGRFQTTMLVKLANDGPVTIILEM